jgi:NADH dehydrogenase ubiquinone Fe-S protein 4
VAQLRIYQPAKTAMQSGRARSRQWIVEFAPSAAQRPDTLMGWAGGGDTTRQVELRFDSRDAAVAYAERRGLDYEIEEPRAPAIHVKSYSDNFRSGRKTAWTH